MRPARRADESPGYGYAREGQAAVVEVPDPHLRMNQISAISKPRRGPLHDLRQGDERRPCSWCSWGGLLRGHDGERSSWWWTGLQGPPDAPR